MRGLKINTPFYTISFYSHFIFGKNKSKERICINILDGLSCVDKRLFSFSKYPFRVDESVAGKKTRKYTERKDFFITAGWDSSLPWVLNNEKDFLPRFRLPRQQHSTGDKSLTEATANAKSKVYWMKFAYKTESDCLSRI